MAAAKAGRRNGSERRNRRAEVTDAAVKVFDEKGYAGAAIQDVADRVGLLKGSLYHYIDSKEDLLAQIVEESDATSFALIDANRKLEESALERLRRFGHDCSLSFLENIERTSIYVNEWKHLTGARLKKAAGRRREYEDRVVEMIEDVVEEGQARSDLDARCTCSFILGAINGLPAYYRRGSGPPEYIADAYAELIVGLVQFDGDPRPREDAVSRGKVSARRKAGARPKAKVKAGTRS